jgi:RNA polymerase sigma factor (sigma-70 family)
MKHNIKFKYFEPKARVRKLIENLIKRLEKLVKDFSDETVFLRVLIEENAVRTLYHISVTLDLPGRVLAAKEERHDVDETIRAAFAEIERQIKRYKAGMRGEQFWKRVTRRAQVRRKKKVEAVPPEERKRELFTGIIEQHLKKLHDFVRREIAYHQSTGELAVGYLSAEDVVDATVLRAYDEFEKKPDSLEIDRWLIKLAIEQLESEIERAKAERDDVIYIGEVIPEVPLMKEASTAGDETQDIYQPYEDLRLEEVIRALEATLPEEVAESREMQHYFNRTFASLPKMWRRVFVLHYVEGLTVREVAEVAGLTEAEVSRYLEYAREYLQQKLAGSGMRFREGGKALSEARARKKSARSNV